MMKKVSLIALALMTPFVAFAEESGGDLGNIEKLVKSLGEIVDTATPVVVGIALLAFFWGLATFIFSAGDEEKREGGKHIMIWGVIALFIMVSIWGIVEFIDDAIGLEDVDSIEVPKVKELQ